jgi:excisionase family DNA binding protein
MTNQERATGAFRLLGQITEGTSLVHRKLYRVEEVAEVLNVGRTKVFDLIRSGQLASVKVGGSRRVTEQAIDDYIDRLCQDSEVA